MTSGNGQQWRLVPFRTSGGREPVNDYLASLRDTDTRAFLLWQKVVLPQLMENGPGVGEPIFKRLSFAGVRDFGEIRFRSGGTSHRLYCSIEEGRKLVLYHAVDKKWNKMKKQDKRICANRYREYHDH